MDPVRVKLASHLCVLQRHRSNSHLGELVDQWINALVFDEAKRFDSTETALTDFLQGRLELSLDEAHEVLSTLRTHYKVRIGS